MRWKKDEEGQGLMARSTPCEGQRHTDSFSSVFLNCKNTEDRAYHRNNPT